VLDYRRFMPPTLITRSTEEIRAFQKEHGAVVIKPLHGNGGKAIFRVPPEGDNLGALLEVFNGTWPEPHMVQPFLPDVAKGDKRIVLIDGVVAGAINRRPGEGEFRSNLAVGGSAEATELTPREQEICAAMGPRLKELGLIFVGIDVIGGEWLTEINVTSPTGIVAIDRFNGTDSAGMIWDAIKARNRFSARTVGSDNDGGRRIGVAREHDICRSRGCRNGRRHAGQLSLVLAGDQIRIRKTAPLRRPLWPLAYAELERD
jgi:glutathione synthase